MSTFTPTPLINYLALVTPDELSLAAEYRKECEDYTNGIRLITWTEGTERADGSRFVTNPYTYNINDTISNEWMSYEDYMNSCEDI